MVLKTFQLDSTYPEIPVKKLTIDAFSKFGSIVSPDEEIKARNLKAGANYGTAIKIRKVSESVNNFVKSSSTNPSRTNFNIFRCFPPNHLMSALDKQDSGSKGFKYLGKVLERHPYSTQTFTPMGRPSSKLAYIVVCALDDKSSEQDLPDPATIEAFYCMGNQAVTYGAGTWHAPMIAISLEFGSDKKSTRSDEDYIDFAVLVNENDVDDDDCQECYFDPGFTLKFALDSDA